MECDDHPNTFRRAVTCVYAPLLSESVYLAHASCCYYYWGIGIVIIIRDNVM